MKNRTNQAKLCRFIEQGDTIIEVTYAPVERVLVFRTIDGGILPIQVKLRDVWKNIRQEWIEAMDAAEKQRTPEVENPAQLQIPEVEAILAAQVPNTLLPASGHKVLQVHDVQPVQGTQVGIAEPAALCVQEPEEPGEAARPCVPAHIPTIYELRGRDGLCTSKG